ncbi:hypothetical protein LOTGIDRAFT_214385 [Lottia gigantea]|uniref:Mannosyl-oligosaccharide glucosidase n=1 Tax=Lottia gigantea TaxID=225164 RepID=V4C5I9_LOTGI|nr:hypothetical protein LOTGIDRAFT_214385 [Lottia gigantea]ESO96854.1 hypothetical protein LOTGIDRAFT_214385 [Lottia gigantea]
MTADKFARKRIIGKHKDPDSVDSHEPKRLLPKHKKDSSAYKGRFITLSCVTVLAILLVGYFLYQERLKNAVNTPLNSPRIIEDDTSSSKVTPERFWGSYRPHTYFGLKTRSKNSPVVGLMWLQQFTGRMPPPIRHWCNQDDKIQGYGWVAHDGVNFGVQEINEDNFKLNTSFVKRMGGKHGGDWTAKVIVTPKVKLSKLASPTYVSLMFYMALDGQGKVDTEMVKNRVSGINGYSEELGNFKISFPKVSTKGAKYNHLVTHTTKLDKLKDVMMETIKIEAWDKARTMPYFILGGRSVPRDSGGPNYIVHQVTAQLPLEMEVIFESGSVEDRKETLSGESYDETLSQHLVEFDNKFSDLFQHRQNGYNNSMVDFAKFAMSNMIGGIGYFYGSSLVQSKYNKEPVEYWKAPLYTAVPSRPFFPRGFLWDEGFHNLLIREWDESISKDILFHWIDLLNSEGWIPREQILGVEARARVPSEFVVQQNVNANPPTFFLPLQKIITNMIKSNTDSDRKILKALYPRLKAWFHWYNSTQVGTQRSVYRWRGRDPNTNKQLNPLTLTSGLDDFPRSSHPTDDERHVDLRCWMALASGVMADIARALNADWEEYRATNQMLTDNKLLDELHWSKEGQQYSDYGYHADKVKLEQPKITLQPGQRPPQQQPDKIRVVITDPKYQFVNSFGYVSLFPFLLKIVNPTSPKLFTIMNNIKNPNMLWTDYGLRSLSRNARLYKRFNTQHDPPYWRGAIWINMNYLALSALNHYSYTTGPYQNLAKSIYIDLRNNLVNNLYRQYIKSGYIWENYDDKTGEGRGTHPFTGWSSLVVLIMAEKY